LSIIPSTDRSTQAQITGKSRFFRKFSAKPCSRHFTPSTYFTFFLISIPSYFNANHPKALGQSKKRAVPLADFSFERNDAPLKARRFTYFSLLKTLKNS